MAKLFARRGISQAACLELAVRVLARLEEVGE
jgi:hypothetical protein